MGDRAPSMKPAHARRTMMRARAPSLVALRLQASIRAFVRKKVKARPASKSIVFSAQLAPWTELRLMILPFWPELLQIMLHCSTQRLSTVAHRLHSGTPRRLGVAPAARCPLALPGLTTLY